LYGALLEAYTYMKGESDILALYNQRYEEALAQLGGVGIRSMRDNTGTVNSSAGKSAIAQRRGKSWNYLT
jgi:hypothetical protein